MPQFPLKPDEIRRAAEATMVRHGAAIRRELDALAARLDNRGTPAIFRELDALAAQVRRRAGGSR